ncbi:hypothetical protein [Paenibacillus sp. FSL M7-0420]|uniref:hypothetical protein n=1 Tax=Paenibacillus sp. FSL M7-0420 TaxID=2921609 RepID=UPI0030F55AB7
MSILSEKAILNTEDVLMKIEEYSSQEAVSPFAKLNLKLLKNSIQNKHGLNMETKHDLVFIGKTRVGKSTNLCSIFNFYYYEGNKKLQMLPADTGGTTTPCTVEIDNFEGATYIEVTNIDNQMLQKYLKVFIQKKIDKDSVESLPEEIQAIIKRKIGKETISQIESIENPVQAVDYIFENTKIEYTNELVCLSPEDECGDINSTFKWVKETLDNIRHGKVEDVFIPLKIVIHISKKVRQLPEWANKIVDTRGIIGADLSEDNNGSNSIMNRDDLKEYINNKNSYVVFITEFADMDNSIKEYYKELLTSTDSDISSTSRHMILISTKPDMVDSKISDEYENESEKEGLRRIVIAEKVESFEGSVLDFVSKLKDSNLERDIKSLEIYTNLVEKVDSFQETKIKLVNLVLFEAKKYYQEGELEEEHSRQIQGVISDKIKVIHSILDNEIRDACELAVSIIKSKTGKDRPSTRLENELETFKK